MLKKIVIIGPESTGKSTLCKELAAHYNTLWCPEFAREYLMKHGKQYNYDDLLTIARGQLALEDRFSTEALMKADISNKLKPTPLFIDTDMYVMKVWCEYVFGKCHRYILNEIISRKYDLYLLCNTDLPWVADELREYPDPQVRNTLYKIYKDIMINQPVPWVDISGDDKERLNKAVLATDKLMGY
jgi:NadR type nicotinamide-nucleotide adenylyltransferase